MLGVDHQAGDGNTTAIRIFQAVANSNANGAYGAAVVPLQFDSPWNQDDAAINDQAGTRTLYNAQPDFILKRVVGKLVVTAGLEEADPAPETRIPTAIAACAALFVADAEHEGQAGSPSVPQGFSDAEIDYSPWSIQNSTQPWMWRRTWMLSTGFTGDQPGNQTELDAHRHLPRNNVQYGAGIFDGPHVDWKGGRRIGQNQRLYLIVWGYNLPISTGSGTWDDRAILTVQAEFRCGGMLIKPSRQGGSVA